ncbi:hypothetical protein [Niabella hibiscisoli]|uniref:hypothetical protein n=1 Tax=Niabella hibiscisoli TaxID=1825928 RepID=UPI001F0D1E60|nr:hypothetical protein [Niabella hibiscisoli]MCH5715460.1 hypothetical protein [Niabella hibiscisoli]
MPFTFEFEDYEFIRDRISNEEEKKKWRTQILSRAKTAYQNRGQSARFYIQVLHSEGRVKKMIEEVTDSLFSYEQIAEYFDIMVATDKRSLLASLITKRAEQISFYNPQENPQSNEAIALIAEKLVQNFDIDYLKLAITESETRRWYQPNKLIQFIKQKLG